MRPHPIRKKMALIQEEVLSLRKIESEKVELISENKVRCGNIQGKPLGSSL